ncbi:unnamed protein product [Staurois parvus]|uniref:Uncharacterized protein n=1 Tax=Staurois parvus TaxID=386267 RepID=A0ABN9CCE2_9NEOB|nr:unnamed protein product [Staurois parvus]
MTAFLKPPNTNRPSTASLTLHQSYLKNKACVHPFSFHLQEICLEINLWQRMSEASVNQKNVLEMQHSVFVMKSLVPRSSVIITVLVL